MAYLQTKEALKLYPLRQHISIMFYRAVIPPGVGWSQLLSVQGNLGFMLLLKFLKSA